ncbi:uncharacterized protein LOC114165901 isoform X2 [Vigna unguiculata]|uniref:uncharacterized protein LOC114165901 isoform X2 n=1 Tax=Vigna unguiculata TaxID=3917 RepID=UPI0010164EBE|nr:uncharacterized protein LOC114165901 isoform X2 [Vigna unguiculata]
MVTSVDGYDLGVDDSYRSLPWLYLMFLSIWFVAACSWTVYTYKTRHTQWNNLQWTLASVPLIKALQLMLSFLFWYSCFNFQACSLWMSFGVYVTGVLFQTAAFVCFLLISHGYCILCERLSLHERRSTATLACIFYLTLIGYKACVPYFSVLLLLNYFFTFYIIFHHISQNLVVLREQLSLIENEDIQQMYDAVYKKYTIFKKFQGAMQIVATAETVEMDAVTFKEFRSHEWHIGVPTSASHVESSKSDVLVIIQHPRAHRLRNLNTFSHSALNTNSSPCLNVTNAAT